MVDQNKKTMDERFLDVLTGREDLDVTGQFLDDEQLHILEDAELLREAIISMNNKEQIETGNIDLEQSKNRLIERLKKDNLL